jgi:hypothetical protein
MINYQKSSITDKIVAIITTKDNLKMRNYIQLIIV